MDIDYLLKPMGCHDVMRVARHSSGSLFLNWPSVFWFDTRLSPDSTLTFVACHLQWADPQELHAIGQYGSDAYAIFCRGNWKSIVPKDKDLLKYHQWLMATNGEGTGLERDPIPGATALTVVE